MNWGVAGKQLDKIANLCIVADQHYNKPPSGPETLPRFHNGEGSNVLYGDGSVRWIGWRICRDGWVATVYYDAAYLKY